MEENEKFSYIEEQEKFVLKNKKLFNRRIRKAFKEEKESFIDEQEKIYRRTRKDF